MTLKEALANYPCLTIYRSCYRYIKAKLATKEEILELFGKFKENMKPSALYLNEAEDKVYLLYKEPRKKKKTKQSKYKVFGIFREGNVKLIKDFKLLPNGYIQVSNYEPAPIEDYGDYMFFENDVTEKQAFDLFLKKCQIL